MSKVSEILKELKNEQHDKSIKMLLNLASKQERIKFAYFCAKDLDKFYDTKKYNEVFEARKKCLDLLGSYMINKNSISEKQLDAAADAADAATYAAAHAADAADAAYAAVRAVHAAVRAVRAPYATYAAAHAAYAADAAAHAAYCNSFEVNELKHLKQLKIKLIKILLEKENINTRALKILFDYEKS